MDSWRDYLHRPTRQAGVAYAIAAVVVALDQWSKAWVVRLFAHLQSIAPMDNPSVQVAPFLRFSAVNNSGISYGLLQDQGSLVRWMLVLFAAVVVVGLGVWISRASKWLISVAIGLVMGGAIGNNLIDRVRFGRVVDFIDVSQIGFKWVFNVADSAITVGVILLLIDTFVASRPPAAAKTS